jgi:hypothetical protein
VWNPGLALFTEAKLVIDKYNRPFSILPWNALESFDINLTCFNGNFPARKVVI